MSQKSKEIFSINSEINGIVKVIDTPDGRELIANDGAMLSCSENNKKLAENYWGVFLETLPKYRNNIKKALIFGLGGGVIQNKLFLKYPGIEITSIEYDPIMNDIYNYYFSGNRFEKHQILNLSGQAFVKTNHRLGDYEGKYDLVFVDTFSSFTGKEFDSFNSFFKETKKFLKPNGIFSINMIIWSKDMFEESQKYLEDASSFYKETEIIFVGTKFGNTNLLTFSSDKLNI